MAELQIGHRKWCWVLAPRFPVVNWRSRPVANSAYYWSLGNTSGRSPNKLLMQRKLFCPVVWIWVIVDFLFLFLTLSTVSKQMTNNIDNCWKLRGLLFLNMFSNHRKPIYNILWDNICSTTSFYFLEFCLEKINVTFYKFRASKHQG